MRVIANRMRERPGLLVAAVTIVVLAFVAGSLWTRARDDGHLEQRLRHERYRSELMQHGALVSGCRRTRQRTLASLRDQVALRDFARYARDARRAAYRASGAPFDLAAARRYERIVRATQAAAALTSANVIRDCRVAYPTPRKD